MDKQNFRWRWTVRRTLAAAAVAALAVSISGLPATAEPSTRFDGVDDLEIRRIAGAELGAHAAELAATVTDRTTAFDALVTLVGTRQAIFDDLQAVRRMTTMPSITLADAIDDSLAHHAATVLRQFAEAVPEKVLSPGAEKFSAGLEQLGFVQEHTTGFLFHLELQQSLILLNEFRQRRSVSEAEDAEDALLRHFALLADVFRAQHVEARDMHLCNVANLDWAVGRFESEEGTSDFYVARQLFSSHEERGFAYFLKLASPTTGETLDIHYPLPHLTAMDEGWQRLQAEKKAREAAESTDG